MALGLRSRYLHAPTIIPAKNLCSISTEILYSHFSARSALST